MPSKTAAMASIVERLARAVTLNAKKEGDLNYLPKPHPPATPEQLADYEKYLGRKLPDSYRAFLELHNGYDWLAFPGHMLSIESVMPGGQHYDDIVEWKKATAEYGGAEVLDGIVIANYDQPNSWIYLDPNRPSAKNELTVVEWDPEDSEDYADVIEFLEECFLTCTEEDEGDVGEDDEDDGENE
jgi:cell wall assembly regulator SMI1